MAVLDIITAPHPILAATAREVRSDELGRELARHMSNMAETMYAAPGVGLAGPQVSDSRRIVVIDSGEGEGRGKRLLQLVNPIITHYSQETITWGETCLSVPGMEVDIKRALRITLQWTTPRGKQHSQQFEEYEAVIVQHELDHLIGRVLLDRVSRFRRSRYLKKMAKAARRR